MAMAPLSIDQLNEQYGLDGRLRIVRGRAGLPLIEIDNHQARAQLSVYAGQLLSYTPQGESEDLLFLSGQAHYHPGKAIRGGVPVCWPWFGPDPEDRGRATHGFARNRLWTLRATGSTAEGGSHVVLGMTDGEETRAIWPQAFDLELRVTVGESLQLELVSRNTGDRPYTITQALHTYFRVGDIAQVRVLGLEDADYLDKVGAGQRKTQHGPILIDQEVDRIYDCGAHADLVIDDGLLGRRIRIAQAGSRTAVVWNPWQAVATQMVDLADDDYRRFVCVETSNAAADVVNLAPGVKASLSAGYRVERM